MQALLAKTLLHLFALLPLRAVHAIGAAFGWAMVAIPNRSRSVARTNIDLCFPELEPRARRRLVRRALIEMAKTATEIGPLWRWPRQRVLPLIKQVSGAELLRDAMAQGKGAIIAAPHLGAWEVVGLYCSARYPMTNMYRPPRVAALDGVMRHGRERLGATLVPTDASGVRSLYEALARGELVGILPDQDPRHGAGVFAPFFGIPAKTMVLLPRLAAKSGAPVIYAYAERLPKGAGYHLHFCAAPEGIAARSNETATAAMNQGVENCVRALRSQYQWGYKRFRSRPPGEARFY